MNAIGKIGKFIMIYEEPITVAVIAILVVGAVILIGKAIAAAGKQQRMLTQISEAVSEINTNVKNLSGNRTEVIYIDDRTKSGNRTPASVPEIKKTTILVETQDPKEQEQSKAPEAEAPAVKYFSRDCAVAKDGRHYTFEELDAQIRD